MTYVRLFIEQEAILEVDLPVGAPREQLVEAALAKLDESGGAEWETILTQESISAEPIEYTWRRHEREDQLREDQMQATARKWRRQA